MKQKRIMSLLLAVCMILGIVSVNTSAKALDQTVETEGTDYNIIIPQVLENIAESYTDSTDSWVIMDMGAYEKYAPKTENKLTDNAKQQYINSAIKTIKAAEADVKIDKAILSLTAINKNPELLYDINSNDAISAIEILNGMEKSTSAWTAPYTLAAYNQGDYGTDTYETEIVTALLESQQENGCWDEWGTIDTTANVIAGLSFYKDKEGVSQAIDKAVDYLSTQQSSDGTFSDGFSGENSNSTATVIIGLSAAGVDLLNDTRFIKDGKTIIDGLMSFRVADGNGFGHTDNTSIDPGSTEQAFRALVAFMQTVETGMAYNIYDFSENELTPARATGSSPSQPAPSEPSGENITVTVTIKADTGYWLKNYKVTIPGDNATVYDAFINACDDNSITYEGASNGYISSMTKGSKTLAEADKGINSGWLYKVNDELPSVSFTDYEISKGDKIVWYFTEDWKRDPSAGKYGGASDFNEKENNSLKNESFNIEEAAEDTSKYVYETVKNPDVASIGGEWAVLGLARGDADIPSEYFDRYYENVKNALADKNGVLHSKKYTEYSRVIIALTSIGRNPENVGGYNLLTPLTDYEKTVEQGINGAVFALIALDSGDYLKESGLRDAYIDYILKSQNTDGGFAMSGDVSDIDITANALIALSNYKDREAVNTAIDKALSFISKAQLNNGGFINQGAENSESSAQVTVALCSLGIDINDKRFVKNGNSVLDSLMACYSKGNGFKHFSSDSKTNLMATEQALYALAAFNRMNNKKAALYDMSDVKMKTDSNETQNGLPSKSEYVKKLPVINQDKTFADILSSNEKAKIEALAGRGMVNGRTVDEFAPTGTMTRAEFAAIIVKSLGLDITGENIFTDVAYDSWYISYIQTAYYHGIIKGISAREFNPNGTVTKEEAAVMIQRAAKLCGMEIGYDSTAIRNILAGFTDYMTSSDWSKEALAFCYYNNILSNEDIEILPKQAVTREQIAAMLYNMLFKARLL